MTTEKYVFLWNYFTRGIWIYRMCRLIYLIKYGKSLALFFQMYYVPISIFPLPLGLPFCHVNILYGKPQFGRVCLFVFTYFCFYSLGWIISINLSSNLLILLSVSSNLILSLSEYFISAILFFNLKISVCFFIIVSGSIDILNLVRHYCHIFSWF